MKRALDSGDLFPSDMEHPTKKKGTYRDKVYSKTDSSPSPFPFLIPILVMICTTLLTDVDILKGTLAGILISFMIYIPTKKLTIYKFLDCCYEGICSMRFAIILTLFAFAMQKINADLGLADYLIQITLPIMIGPFLPVIVFLGSAAYAFAVGSFWNLAAVLTPIVIPMAIAMNVNPLLAAAAIFSGAAFGSNTCLYGDAIILCAQSTQIQTTHVMLATLPYALISAGISAILYLIFGFCM